MLSSSYKVSDFKGYKPFSTQKESGHPFFNARSVFRLKSCSTLQLVLLGQPKNILFLVRGIQHTQIDTDGYSWRSLFDDYRQGNTWPVRHLSLQIATQTSQFDLLLPRSASSVPVSGRLGPSYSLPYAKIYQPII